MIYNAGSIAPRNPVIIPPPAPIPAVVTQLLMFGMSHEAVPRRKAAHRPSSPVTASDQLELFPA